MHAWAETMNAAGLRAGDGWPTAWRRRPFAIQEFLGHADSKTTQIYAHYAPSEHEVAMVNRAVAQDADA